MGKLKAYLSEHPGDLRIPEAMVKIERLQAENGNLRATLSAARVLLEAVKTCHPKSRVVPSMLKAIKAALDD